jgi:hypothetical protein
VYKKHAALTDLKKLRAPLFEPLQAVAELEAHMGKFVLVLASLKLSATGHGEDPYRYFELFLESFLDDFYQTVPQQTIISFLLLQPTLRILTIQLFTLMLF